MLVRTKASSSMVKTLVVISTFNLPTPVDFQAEIQIF
jgi:hypothetical protein